MDNTKLGLKRGNPEILFAKMKRPPDERNKKSDTIFTMCSHTFIPF